MGPAARDVCMVVGGEQLWESDGVTKSMQMLRDSFAPEALNFVRREVARFMHFKRSTHTMEENLVRFDLLRSKTESRMLMGGPSPKTFGSILRMQETSLSRTDKSLVSVSAQGDWRMASVETQRRRFFGSAGNVVRRDVLAATDMGQKADNASDPDDFGARVAYEKAKKNLTKKERDGGRRG